jgi:hypothetical protein
LPVIRVRPSRRQTELIRLSEIQEPPHVPTLNSPQEFSTMMAAETRRWSTLVREAGIRVE